MLFSLYQSHYERADFLISVEQHLIMGTGCQTSQRICYFCFSATRRLSFIFQTAPILLTSSLVIREKAIKFKLVKKKLKFSAAEMSFVYNVHHPYAVRLILHVPLC